MTIFRVSVPTEILLAGYASDGARLNVLPGEYDVCWLGATIGGQDPTLHSVLRFMNADRRGGDLDVKKTEFEAELSLDEFRNWNTVK